MKILQIGLGGFGKFHLQAWLQLGMRDHLYIAERLPERQTLALAHGMPADHIALNPEAFLDQVDAVDIVTPTDSHAGLIQMALSRGKDVFVEKPMTMNLRQAQEVHRQVSSTQRILQVGFYYRVHPLAQMLRELVRSGQMGQIRYLCGRFLGFKRARTDVGVTHTDAIHFLDLANWVLGAFPQDVYAVTRDHFGRGMEDLSIVLLTYPGQVLTQIESGYIQPGRWNDPVVAKAKTTKEFVLCGSQKTVEIDFEAGTLEIHTVRHELVDGVWQMVSEGSHKPSIARISPVDQVARELAAFMNSMEKRQLPEADVMGCGVGLAELMETIYRSAALKKVIRMEQEEAVPVAAERWSPPGKPGVSCSGRRHPPTGCGG